MLFSSTNKQNNLFNNAVKHLFRKKFTNRFLFIIFPVIFTFFALAPGPDAGPLPHTNIFSPGTVPDIIFYHGTIITMDPAYPQAQALAIHSDTIIAVGSDDEILALAEQGAGTRIYDLQGLTILPGFNDSHTHWFSWREHICSLTHETTYPPLEEIMDMLSANGWTSISELNFGRPDYAPEHLNNALDLETRGKLSVRLNGYWGTLDDGSLIDVLEDSMHRPDRIYSDRIHAPGVKMYVDDPFGTTDILTQEQTNQLVQMAHDRGWQVAAHAVNESAVEKILTAYENVLGGESNDNYRYRIEHAVKVSDDQLNRMKQKGIIASFQLLGPPDWPEQETFQTYISNTHPEWCLRWKDFVNAESQGLFITGSSDAPFNDAPCEYSPFRLIYQAVTRLGYLNRTHADWERAQRLTIANSLKLLTLDGAYATFEEDKKGSLTPGKWADLVVVSQNPLEVGKPKDLLDIKIYMTMVGGQIEYCDEAGAGFLCSPVAPFSTDDGIITASSYLADQTPDMAFDKNSGTNWGSGDYAPQWIQIDLLEDIRVTGIDLQVDQWPAGPTVHQIWAKNSDPTTEFFKIHEFRQPTAIDQVLLYRAPANPEPYRYFKILTTSSSSWVSWKEITFLKQDATFVQENAGPVLQNFSLMQNYPNPFNPVTNISFEIHQRGNVLIAIYDIHGATVAILMNKEVEEGSHTVVFDAQHLPSGIYVCTMRIGKYSESVKMLLVK